MDLNEIFQFLMKRGYSFGNGVIGPDGFGVLISGKLIPEAKLRLLAKLEACKSADFIADGDFLKHMAAMCLRVADHPSLRSHSADEARKLAAGVAELHAEKNRTVTEIEQLGHQSRVLCTQMAYLLTLEFSLLPN